MTDVPLIALLAASAAAFVIGAFIVHRYHAADASRLLTARTSMAKAQEDLKSMRLGRNQLVADRNALQERLQESEADGSAALDEVELLTEKLRVAEDEIRRLAEMNGDGAKAIAASTKYYAIREIARSSYRDRNAFNGLIKSFEKARSGGQFDGWEPKPGRISVIRASD